MFCQAQNYFKYLSSCRAAVLWDSRPIFKEGCPIEIKIPKEIRNYHETIFFGLNTRQFICSLLALCVAVGLQAWGHERAVASLGSLQCWPIWASNHMSAPALPAGGPEARQAVGVYFALQPRVGTGAVGWMCILAAAPFAACGFFSYHGLTAEQLLWAWIKSEVLFPKRLVYRSDSLYYRAMQPAIFTGCKPKKKKRRMPMKKTKATQPENPGE